MSGKKSYVKFVEDEDIYIECKPVDIAGEVITDTNNTISTDINNEILDTLSSSLSFDSSLSGKSIYDNVGFQTLIGIILLAILYAIGNFIFKKIPQAMKR